MLNILKKYRYCVVFFFLGGFLISGLAYNVMGRAVGYENLPLIALVPGFCVGSISAITISFLVIRNRHVLLDRLAAEQKITHELQIENAQRKRAEEALSASEAQMRLVTDNIPALIAYADRDRIVRFANKPFADYLGGPFEAIEGRNLSELLTQLGFGHIFATTDETNEREMVSDETVSELPGGRKRYLRATLVPHDDKSRGVLGQFVIVQDMTGDYEREMRLRQAQKMEAVGQLTGGIAHDFNNLLAIIVGNVSLLENDLGEQDKALATIHRAATRGSELTQRLLAFSRQQPLRPRPIEIGGLVKEMKDLLRRTLGETIEVESHVCPDQWLALADPGQLESAILNLGINARDAMPNGGRLTIETTNRHLDPSDAESDDEAAPGDYVVLAVSDNGLGMSPEVQARAFEPFFTTKEVGQGSGLGLPMVYGFTKQSGGYTNITSEVGRGTTVKLYLPRAVETVDNVEKLSDAEVPRGRGETILVIEDNADVLDLTITILKGLGYRVVAAADAAEARQSMANEEKIDLILTDVVLPGGVSGLEFAAEINAARPDLKLIFMSGYPTEAARGKDFLEPDAILLTKPFSTQHLAKALRDALERSPR